MRDWREHISINPSICHGKACVAGTRVLVSTILDILAAGIGRGEVLRSYPVLRDSDIDAALSYAAELTREGFVDLPLETTV